MLAPTTHSCEVISQRHTEGNQQNILHTTAGMMSQSSNPYLTRSNLRDVNRIVTATTGRSKKTTPIAIAWPFEVAMMAVV